jgi:transcriptional regulator with XRE-family HTH domain
VNKSIHSPPYEAIKARLVALRKAAGLTQRGLAERLKREWSFVAKLELGERRLDLLELFYICKACGTHPDKVATELMREILAIDQNASLGSRKKRGGRKSR